VSEIAPGKLDLVRRFLNTVSFGAGEDGLSGPDKLPEWCAAEGFECGSDLSRLRAFREALRAAALANAGHADRVQSWQALKPFAAESRFTLEVSEDGTPELRAGGGDPGRAIATLLAIVYDSVRDKTWPRFKACIAGDCQWAFYDESKNGSGTWCSMAVCGNRYKARRRRSREQNTTKATVRSTPN
jgi:predicted RNA-binding Zn ribbon-like protein